MDKVCSHCGASAIEVDDEGKVEVCSNCGVVRNEGSFHNDAKGGGEKTFTSDHSSFSGGAGNWRNKKQHRIENRNFVASVKCLQGQAERLRLSKEHITQVEGKLRMVYDEQLLKGLPKNRKAYVGACVYIVCRQNDMVVTLRNVAEAARCDASVLARCVKKLSSKMNVQLEAIEPHQIITNILSQFEIQDSETKKLVHDLFKFCSKTMICSGKRIVLTIMALVFMVFESMKIKAVNRKKINEVCRLNTVRHEHVQRFVRQFRAEFFKLAKNIPWISSTVTPKEVHKFLKEILDYYEDCEDLHNVDFKPHWLERKDIIEKEKMQKIEKAEKRIAACQQRCGDLVIDDDISLHKNCKQVPRSSTKGVNSEVSSLLSSPSVPSTATELASEVNQTDGDHVCCPHCCINKQNCPVYQRTGTTSFCKLDRCDMIMECLLRKGNSKQELVDGNPESIFYSKNYDSVSEPEKEELDDDDICDKDIQLYIRTKQEVAQAEMLKPMVFLSDERQYKN